MKSVFVSAGATLGSRKAYQLAVKQIGKEFAERNLHLVYGGGRNGLMGTLADTVLKTEAP